MKIRSGGGISEAAAKALGASPLVKPAPESYEILSSGIADGTFFPRESVKSFNLDKVVKYATFFPGGFYSSSFGFFMNEDKWNAAVQAGPGRDHLGLGRGAGAARRQGRGTPPTRCGMETLKAANVHDHRGEPRVRRRRAQAHRAAGAGVDQVGQRQGRRRRQGLCRVPRGAEEGRGRQVSRLALLRRALGFDARRQRSAPLAHPLGLDPRRRRPRVRPRRPADRRAARARARSGRCRSAWPSTRPRKPRRLVH